MRKNIPNGTFRGGEVEPGVFHQLLPEDFGLTYGHKLNPAAPPLRCLPPGVDGQVSGRALTTLD